MAKTDPCKDQRQTLKAANRALTEAEKAYDRSLEVEADKEGQWFLDGFLTTAVTLAAVAAAPESGGMSLAVLFGVAGGGAAGGASGWFSDEDDVEDAWQESADATEDFIEAEGAVSAAALALKHCEEKVQKDEDMPDGALDLPADPEEGMPDGDLDLRDPNADMPDGDMDLDVRKYTDVETTRGGNYFYNTRLDHGPE